VKRARVLLVDADPGFRAALRAALGPAFDVTEVDAIAEALLHAGATGPDAVLVQAGPGGQDAIELLRGLRGLGSDAAVVALVPSGGVHAGVEAMRAGAEAFAAAPLGVTQAALILERALERRGLARERARLREQVRRRHALVGSVPELQTAREVIRRAAPTKATLLVFGETGTGRELVAQLVHESSPRRNGPFVRVNCAAMSQQLLEAELFGHEPGAFADAEHRSEGRVLAAQGGTLLLHEIGGLPPLVQIRLLRLLQHGELERVGGTETLRADVRVVATTSRDLAAEVHAGRFRDDLYYRLNVVSVGLPPLRARKADIPALFEHLASRACRAVGAIPPRISPGALSALFAYDWPGNVRELETVVERALQLAPGASELGPDHLAPFLHGTTVDSAGVSGLIPGATLFEIEREAILRTLEEVGGSTTRAAEVLGVSVRKIQYRLKEYKAGSGGRRRRGDLADVA
jgi:two-component system NtrC family response regulator